MKKLRHVVSAKDFDFISLLEIFRTTAVIKNIYNKPENRTALSYLLIQNGRALRFRILTNAPSTRTISSFEDAIEALGGTVLIQLLQFSSLAKGETYRSTARILGPRTDCIIIRDDKNTEAPQEMADAVSIYQLNTVIIDAGSGNKEHPTQTLTDLFTVWERDQKRFESGTLHYALVGDLQHSRTIHSLLIGLAHFGGTVSLVGLDEENIPDWILPHLESKKLVVSKFIDPLLIAPSVDYWYFTRLQTNLRTGSVNHEQETEYTNKYGATERLRHAMKSNAFILHPLPHGKEYEEGIDLIDPRFIHYQQADNGFFVRMALLKLIFAAHVDLRIAVADQEKVEISGHFDCVEIPIRSINAVCVMKSCPQVRIDRNSWVTLHIETKERIPKPKVFCPRCKPV